MTVPGEQTGRLKAIIEGPMKPGTVLQDGTTVGQYIGRSVGALSFFGEHPDAGKVVVKVLAKQLDAAIGSMSDTFASLGALTHPSLQRLVGQGEIGPRHYLVYEYVDGRTLRSAIARRVERRGPFDMQEAYNVLSHASLAVEQLHSVTVHGVLTSENVFVERNGRIKVGNIGFARLTVGAVGADDASYADSAYLAPEVREDTWGASEASDIYSLGVLLVALLTGEHPTRGRLPALVEDLSASGPTGIDGLLAACLAEEPIMRVQTLAEFREGLVDVMEGPALVGLPREPTPIVAETELETLFAGIDLPPPPTLAGPPPVPGASSSSTEVERWIVQIDGRDYGPFTTSRVHEMLEADEVDEHTTVSDVSASGSSSLVDVPEFTDYVMDYLPRRAKRRLEQEARRKAVVKQARRTGRTTIVAGVLAVVAGAAFLIALRTDSPPMPFADIIQPMNFHFVVDEPVYTEIAADEDLIASLFDFSDPPPPEAAPSRSNGGGGGGGGGAAPTDDFRPAPSTADYAVTIDPSQPSRKLSSGELNATLRANQDRLQRCFQNELRSNPRFRGVTIHASILPDGRTTDIDVDGDGPVSRDAERCLVESFERIRFPEFNDFPMNVRFPFRLQ